MLQVILDCGKSYIQAISVIYGNPAGSCHCPSIQQPSSKGTCPGSIRTSDGSEHCSHDLYGNVEACFYSELDAHHYEPQPCCAFHLNEDDTPDLSDLHISPNYTCNSLTAQHIAEGMCVGKSSCVLTSDSNHAYSWTGPDVERVPYGVCNATTTEGDGSYRCNTTLGYAGLWSSCATAESRRMMVQVLAYVAIRRCLTCMYYIMQAVCSPDDVHILGSSITKTDAVILSSILNGVAMVVFILGIYWVAHQQVLGRMLHPV